MEEIKHNCTQHEELYELAKHELKKARKHCPKCKEEERSKKWQQSITGKT